MDTLVVSKGMGHANFVITPLDSFKNGISYNVCADLKTLKGKTIITDCEVDQAIEPSIIMTNYSIDMVKGELNVTVNYADTSNCYVSIYLGDINWGFIANDTLIVKNGTGVASFKITPSTPFENGISYNVCADLKTLLGKTIITDCEVAKTPTTTSISTADKFKVSIFPNPSSGQINIQTDIVGELSFTLFDLNGKTINKTIAVGPTLAKMQLINCKKGVYILKVEGRNDLGKFKVVVN
jgi:hypothetical protein